MEALFITIIILAFFFTLAIVVIVISSSQEAAAQAGVESLGRALIHLVDALKNAFK